MYCIKEAPKGELILAIGRIMLGLMLIWSFLDKMFGLGRATPSGQGWLAGYSPSEYLTYFDGPFAEAIIPYCGTALDILLMAGLVLIGAALILGIGKKIGTVAAVAFYGIMYFVAFPPTDNLILDHRLIFIVLVLAIYFGNGWNQLSLSERWKETILVKKYPLLE
jgi:thiosulfate dehydrogenase [quinone] large subunit